MIDIKAPRTKLMGAFTRIAGIAGFIAILGIGMWGSVAIARNTPGVFSALAAAVTSFTSVFIPANHAPAPTATTTDETIATTTPVVETPIVEAPAPVTPKPTVPRTAGPETSNTYPLTGTGATASNPNGYVDLSARVIEQGVVNKDTGVFTASSSPNRADPQYRVAVRFAVENLGTKTSPQFTFNAVLPTYPANIFSAPSQPALGPGDRIEFTLGFDQIADSDTGTFTINVDPTGGMNESNKSNNIVHYTVTSIKK
jgi:hypothetical protein